jgi:HEAT repeat protein
MRRVAAILLLAAALGCAAPAEKPSGGGGAAKAPAKQPAKKATPDRERADQHAGEGKEFTVGERAKMEVAWEAFKDESPAWPAMRDDWFAMGGKARVTLIENLLRAMILSRLANFPQGALRARSELILLGPDVVPLVEGVLEDPNFFDPRQRKVVRLATEIQNELTELLLVNGEAAVPSLVRLSSNEVPGVRRNAMDALGRLKAEEGIPVLAQALRTRPHWIDRMTAARALGYGASPAATRALVAALSDKDETVVIEAARALARQGARSALPALERREKQAVAEDDYKVSRACRDAAKIIRSPEK